eukprot:5288008-Amphidinium_carterae.1
MQEFLCALATGRKLKECLEEHFAHRCFQFFGVGRRFQGLLIPGVLAKRADHKNTARSTQSSMLSV